MIKFDPVSGIQVGDKVWWCPKGYGKLELVDKDSSAYPLYVVFDTGGYCTFTLDGKNMTSDTFPSLFYDPWSGIHGVDPYPTRLSQKELAWRWAFGTYDGRITDIPDNLLTEKSAEQFRILKDCAWKVRIYPTEKEI